MKMDAILDSGIFLAVISVTWFVGIQIYKEFETASQKSMWIVILIVITVLIYGLHRRVIDPKDPQDKSS